jgi:hypothetical protein
MAGGKYFCSTLWNFVRAGIDVLHTNGSSRMNEITGITLAFSLSDEAGWTFILSPVQTYGVRLYQVR